MAGVYLRWTFASSQNQFVLLEIEMKRRMEAKLRQTDETAAG